MIEKVNIAEKLSLFAEHWSPRIVGEVNDSYVKLVKFQGEFVWHKHDTEDEMFLVVKGAMRILLRDGEIRLGEGRRALYEVRGRVDVRARVRAEVEQRDVGRVAARDGGPRPDLYAGVARVGRRPAGCHGHGDVVESHRRVVNSES